VASGTTSGTAGPTTSTVPPSVLIPVASNLDGGGKPLTQSVNVATSTGHIQPSQVTIGKTNGAAVSTAATARVSIPVPVVGNVATQQGGGKPSTKLVNAASSAAHTQPPNTASVATGTTNGAAVSTAATARASIPVPAVSYVATQHGGGKPSTQLVSVASYSSAAHAQPSNTASVATGINGAVAATSLTAQSTAPIPPSNSTVQPAKRKAGDLDCDASAQAFVDSMQAMIDQMKRSTKCNVELILEKKLVERALIAQEEFHGEGKPFNIDIGYHYTVAENVASIQNVGLLSKDERSSKGIKAKFNGASYGNGIYTCSNPSGQHGKFGNVGLMVGRLVGTNRDHDASTRLSPTTTASDSTTVLLNQVPLSLVLSDAKQCFPILRFDARQIDPKKDAHPGNVSLAAVHAVVQRIIDDILQPRKVKAKVSASQQVASTQALPAAPEQVLYVAPETLGVCGQRNVRMAYRKAAIVVFCALAVGMVSCGLALSMHMISVRHFIIFGTVGICIALGVIVDYLLGRSRNKTVGAPQGDMPSGDMTIGRSVKPCDGYVGFPTITIQYNFPAGKQKMYHRNPGVDYNGTCRHAYVPDTAEGRSLLKRLKFAFQHGLTFSVGVSKTTLKDNSVIWGSIPHKTSMGGGVLQYGFPDLGYIDDCNSELDTLGVPKAELL
jgi:deltex